MLKFSIAKERGNEVIIIMIAFFFEKIKPEND